MTNTARQKKAVVLLSGGIDSATTLAVVKQQGFEIYALSFDYGQRHKIEIQAAKKVAKHLGTKEHQIFELDLRQFGGSALTGNLPVPKDGLSRIGEIPITYVPARNMIFLSLAVGYAESLGAADIFIGANEIDYSGYPDCRPEFLASFEKMANLGTRVGVEGNGLRIVAPLVNKSKAEIIRLGIELGVDFGLTISCYDPTVDGQACGECESCRIRRTGFECAGVSDPTKYAAGSVKI